MNLLANTGGLKTRGVDFEARYSMPLNFGILGAKTGKLDFRISGTRLIQHDLNPLAAIPELTQKCAGKFGIYCGNPYSKLRLSNRVTWATTRNSRTPIHRPMTSMVAPSSSMRR